MTMIKCIVCGKEWDDMSGHPDDQENVACVLEHGGCYPCYAEGKTEDFEMSLDDFLKL
jgi:hypothetical protein